MHLLIPHTPTHQEPHSGPTFPMHLPHAGVDSPLNGMVQWGKASPGAPEPCRKTLLPLWSSASASMKEKQWFFKLPTGPLTHRRLFGEPTTVTRKESEPCKIPSPIPGTLNLSRGKKSGKVRHPGSHQLPIPVNLGMS